VLTKADGGLLSQEEYFPSGRPSDRRDARNRYRYIGVERDEDTGLCMTGPRTYDPVSGRFLQGDPLVKPGRSPFEYAASNPVRRRDPGGYQDGEATPRGWTIVAPESDTGRTVISMTTPGAVPEATPGFEASLAEILSASAPPDTEKGRSYVRLGDGTVAMSDVVMGDGASVDLTESYTDEFRQFAADRGGIAGVVAAHTHPLPNTAVPGVNRDDAVAGSNLIPSQPTTERVREPRGEAMSDLDNILGGMNTTLPEDSPYAGSHPTAHIVISDSPLNRGKYSVTTMPANPKLAMDHAGGSHGGTLGGYASWLGRLVPDSHVYKGRIGRGRLRER
jgi:RHS repeat-associated protein